MNWTDLRVVLTWLSGAGAIYLAGVVVAYLVENWPAWHVFPSWVKFVLPIIFSVGVSLGASALLGQPDFLEVIGPYFTLVVTIILAWLGTQNGYMKAKAMRYGADPKYLK